MRVDLLPITINDYCALASGYKKAIIVDEKTHLKQKEENFLLLNAWSEKTKVFLNPDQHNQAFFEGSTTPLLSSSLLFEITYIEHLPNNKLLVSMNPVTHILKRSLIMTNYQQQKRCKSLIEST